MSITRITPWAVNAPASGYGVAASLSGTATNVPAGALIVTSVVANATTTPTVSDTAGNTYVVVLGKTSTYNSVWFAYCLSAKANTANVVTWHQSSGSISSIQGATYSTSSGTWSFGTSVAGVSAYATPLSLTVSIAGAGVIYGGFGEYYTGTDTWSITGLTAQASQAGSSSGNGTIGCLMADDITTGAVSSLAISVSDANGGYGGYVAGVAASFVVSGGGGTTYTQSITGSLTPTGSLGSAVTFALALSGAITAAGSLAKRTARSIAGSVTTAGALTKATSKALAGSLAPTGAISRATSKNTTGSITPTGALSQSSGLSQALSGSVTVAGSLAKRTARGITGSITAAGQLAKRTARSLAGNVTPSGALSESYQVPVSLSGLITVVGSLTTSTGKVVRALWNTIAVAIGLRL